MRTVLLACLLPGIVASLGAEMRPLPARIGSEPLAYLRWPLPWQSSQALSSAQQRRLLGGLLPLVTAPNEFGVSLRGVLQSIEGPLELVLVEPDNATFIMPGFVLRGRHAMKREEMMARLKGFFLSSLQQMFDADFGFLKFQTSEKDGMLVETTFLMLVVHARLQVSDEEFFFSCSTDKEFKSLGWSTKNSESWMAREKSWGGGEQDLVLYADTGTTLKLYTGVLEQFAPQQHVLLRDLGLMEMSAFSAVTRGSGKSFEVEMNVAWTKAASGMWGSWGQEGDAARGGGYKVLPDSDFTGGVYLPDMKVESLANLLGIISPVERAKAPAYIRLRQTLSGNISFSWPKTSPAPVVMAELKDVAAFEKEIENLFAGTANFSREKTSSGNFTHILWQGSALSYVIREKDLFFCPLIHPLRDLDLKAEKTDRRSVIFADYPYQFKKSSAYYALMLATCQALVAGGKKIDPSMFPPFKSLGVADEKFSGSGHVSLETAEAAWKLLWRQPYGLPGLMSGIELTSAEWLHFLALLGLTKASL